jgi:hypothetical protein
MASANVIQTSVSGGTSNALAMQGDGVFLPKLDTVSRIGLTLTSSDAGFIVFDTTLNNLFIWNATAWESIPSSGDSTNLQVLFNDNGIISGDVGFTFDKTSGKINVLGDGQFNGITVGKGLNSLSGNTALGSAALASTQSGATNNTASGNNSQRYNIAGIGNTSFGSSTLSNLLFSGSSNVAVGYQAGASLASGSSNILLGRACATETTTSSNQICIGSTSYWVGTNGGPTVWWAGASGAIGYWRVVINGTPVKIPVYAD